MRCSFSWNSTTPFFAAMSAFAAMRMMTSSRYVGQLAGSNFGSLPGG